MIGEPVSLSLELMMVIYVITHVASGRQYVGQTVKKAKHRWREHCNAGRGTSDQTYHYSMYIANAMRKHGVEAFTFKVIEVCGSREELDEREPFWIRKLGTLEPHGFNLREGPLGMVGVKIAPSVGRKISKANKGREKGPEWRAALSVSHTGKVLTEEHCINIGNVVRGRKDSDETRLKKSLALKGRPQGPCTEKRRVAIIEGMARMTNEAKCQMVQLNSIARTGVPRGPQSEEHRAKIGAAQCGRTHTDETKALISQAQLGKTRGPYSEEHCANISASLKGKVPSKATLEAAQRPEVKERRRASLRGRVVSAETREKTRQSSLGKHHSDATLAKMRVAQQKRREREAAVRLLIDV